MFFIKIYDKFVFTLNIFSLSVITKVIHTLQIYWDCIKDPIQIFLPIFLLIFRSNSLSFISD